MKFQLFLRMLPILMLAASDLDAAETMDLSQAVIVATDDNVVVMTAQRMLAEEIAKRTGVNLAKAITLGEGTRPAILLSRVDKAPMRFVGNQKYQNCVKSDTAQNHQDSQPQFGRLADHDPAETPATMLSCSSAKAWENTPAIWLTKPWNESKVYYVRNSCDGVSFTCGNARGWVASSP